MHGARAMPGSMPGHVDAHHHVWSLARGDYGWLTPALAPIYRDYTLKDLRPLREQAGVPPPCSCRRRRRVAETRYLLDVAERSDDVVKGVVGWVDLGSPTAIPTLTHFARNPLFKAVRPMLQDMPDPAWILRAEVGRALAALPRLGVRFEALVKPAQLPALLTMLDRNPDLAVVIDHAAKPDIANGMAEPWTRHMRAIAENPRVRCKLSGLVTEAGPGWTIDMLRPVRRLPRGNVRAAAPDLGQRLARRQPRGHLPELVRGDGGAHVRLDAPTIAPR